MYLFQITVSLCLYYFLLNSHVKSYYFILNNNIKQNLNKMGNCFKINKKILVEDEINQIITNEKINHFHKKMQLNKEINNFSTSHKRIHIQNNKSTKKLKKRIRELEQQNRELEMTVLNTLKYQKVKSKTNEEIKEAYDQKIIESYVIPDRQNNSN